MRASEEENLCKTKFLNEAQACPVQLTAPVLVANYVLSQNVCEKFFLKAGRGVKASPNLGNTKM